MSIIEKISSELENFNVNTADALEKFRMQFLSKKSELQGLLSEIKNVPVEERKNFGQQVNLLKQRAQAIFEEHRARLEANAPTQQNDIDVTRTAATAELGSRHPISLTGPDISRK